MNIKPPTQSVSIFVRDLNANDRFMVPGLNTVYVCDSRQTGAEGEGTRVNYRVEGTTYVFTCHKPSLSTIYLLTD